MKGRQCVVVIVLVAGVLAAASRIAAHHSLTAEFDTNRTISLSGTITAMKWTNPHSWLYIDVKNARGEVENWAVEFASPNSLYRRGWRKSDLPPKDVISVVGYPSRDTKTRTISATDVKLPDGRTLFAGTPLNSTR
jgi:uncharacterized protein DUF6152